MADLKFDLHAMRYGEVVSADLVGTEYDEEQCGECPHDHCCCDLIVTVTPAEVAGILQWLNTNAGDVAETVRVIQFRATVLQEHFKKYSGDIKGAIWSWAKKGMKCVFYDKEAAQCSIYSVRPVACRRVSGQGDCTDEKAKAMRPIPDAPAVLTARVARYKIHQDMNQNLAELTSLVSVMMSGTDQVYVDQDFFTTDPETLTEDQVIFGFAGAPISNPVALETDNGCTRRPGKTVS